ncbi:MAG TPA: NF038122 family metalloprotease [Planctomycetota bacterium]|nr:NF038122 family metalloprotease [Planctomycetota bacterium]
MSSYRNRRLPVIQFFFLALIASAAFAEDAPPPRPPQYTHTRVLLGKGQAWKLSAPQAKPRATGLTIVPNFDSSITNDPRASDIMATINSAIAVYKADYSDPVTVQITFVNSSSGLGASQTNTFDFAYSDYRAALASHATTADDTTALAHLPNTSSNPVNGDPNVTLATSLARALGFSADPPPGQPDSTITVNVSASNITSSDTDPNKYSLFATVSHEIDEALGFGSQLDSGTTGPIYPEDLYRYDNAGNRSFTRSANASSFFSLDGTTLLAQFNQDKSGDFGDWYSVNGGQTPQVQDAFGTPGDHEVLGVELRVLDAIGWTRGQSGGGGPNLPPVITSAANCSPNPAFVDVPATFTVGASDPDNDTLSVAWDFGDGETGSGASTTHTYNTQGNFTATATVTDGRGGSVTSSVSVQTVLQIVKSPAVKKKFSLNFKTSRDGIDVTIGSGDFSNPADGTTINFIIGDVTGNNSVVFDSGTLSRGKATGNFGKFTVNTRLGTARYFTTNASLQDLLANYGAINGTTSTTVAIPIYIFYNGGFYGDTYDFSYTAVAGRSGRGK